MNQQFLDDNRRTKIFAFAIIISLGIAIYSNSLHGEFCFDDYLSIVRNLAIKDTCNIVRIWYAFNTRFIVGLSFAFNYWLGKLHVFGYHLVNLALHIFNSILVYYFVVLTFQTPVVKKNYSGRHIYRIALFSSLLFLCHPIQTQAVAYITQRATSLAAFFYLTSVILYVKSRLDEKPIYLLGAIIATLLGAFTKETIVTIPFLLITYEFFFFGFRKGDGTKRLKGLLPFFIAVCIIPFVLYLDHSNSVFTLKNHIANRPFQWKYFLTEINVMRTYIRLFFFPFNQHHDYDYPISQSFFEPSVILSSFLLIAIVIFAIRQFNKTRIVSFSIAWFFITLLVEVIHPCFVNKGVLYEHWMYLAMVGSSLFLTAMVYALIPSTKISSALLVVIVLIFCVLTYERNKIWQSEFALWHDNIKKAPGNATGYLGLGILYGRKGDYDKEIEYYKTGILLNPHDAKIYHNLGFAYQMKGDFDQAIRYYMKALELRPEYSLAYCNLGAVYATQGNTQEAITYCQKAIALNPMDVEAFFTLAILYDKRGQYQKAIKCYKKIIDLDRTFLEAYQNKSVIHLKLAQFKEAIKDSQRVLELNDESAEAYAIIGTSYFFLRRFSRARDMLEKAITLYKKQGKSEKIGPTKGVLRKISAIEARSLAH